MKQPGKPSDMSVLVTGGTGFIGSHIVDALVAANASVRVLDNFSTGSPQNLAHHKSGIEVLRADLSEPGVAEKACINVDTIFHFAAIPSVPRSIVDPVVTQRNGELATVLLLQAAAQKKVRRLILASSCSVYGANERLPISENCTPHPISPYAASKLACEGYLTAFSQCHEIDTIALRYFNVFGPRQDASSSYAGVISIFLARMLAGETPKVFGDGEQTRDFVFVQDAAAAALLAMHSPKRFDGVAVTSGSGQRYSLNQLVETLNVVLGTSIKPTYGRARDGDIRHSRADVAAAHELLGYRPKTSLHDGLCQYLEWSKAAGTTVEHLYRA